MWVHEGGHASKKIKGIGGRGGGRLLFVVRRDGGHCVVDGRGERGGYVLIKLVVTNLK